MVTKEEKEALLRLGVIMAWLLQRADITFNDNIQGFEFMTKTATLDDTDSYYQVKDYFAPIAIEWVKNIIIEINNNKEEKL